MNKKSIESIEKDAKPLDLIILALPASVMTCSTSMGGTDYAVGFFEGVKDGCVYLTQIQKSAYLESKACKFPKEDIDAYQILRRYKPNPSEDGIDEVLCEILGIHIPDYDPEGD
ncbi:hypothetical protein J4471_00525 [Candidatus Woesearchaeota archaeon]|nr:hypothetical protein [Candidatus Woesearchaeota archaeon]